MAKNEIYTKRDTVYTTDSPHPAFPDRVRRDLSRAKDYAKNLSDDGQETPDEYAENQVQYAAEDSVRETGQGLTHSAQKAVCKAWQRKDLQNRAESAKIKNRSEPTARRYGEAIRPDEMRFRSAEHPQQGGNRYTAVPHRAIPAQEAQRAAIKATETAKKTAKDTARATQQSKRATIAAQRTAEAAGKAAKVAAKATARAVKAIVEELKVLIMEIAAGGSTAAIVIVIICAVAVLAGSAYGIFFANEDNGSGMTLQTAVREINAAFLAQIESIETEIPHDVEEQSGTRAEWKDVLAVYAVMTTTASENPMDVASMTDEKRGILTEIFWDMNEIQTRTETETIHGDNREPTTKTILYIEVSHKTAAEIAEAYEFDDSQTALLNELLSDKYTSLWSNALYGSGTGDGTIVSVAMSQLGNVGGEPYWRFMGYQSRVEWCACFVSWCANECGYIQDGSIPSFASCPVGVSWFKSQGQWCDGSYIPNPGDIIFFDWIEPSTGRQNGNADHVGIVEKVENGCIYTIEGNAGDCVRENRFTIGYYAILGYGTRQE